MMKITKPDYYADFACLAGECPNTCCGNWEIGIDEGSLSKYAELKGDYGREVRNAVDWMQECFLQVDHHCRLLTGDGLCGLQVHFGEAYLCETCRTYPRHVEEFEGRREYTLAVSCPEAARLVLEKGIGQMRTEETDEEDPYEYEDFDRAYFAEMLDLRERILKGGDAEPAPVQAPVMERSYEERKRLLEYLLRFDEIDHRWKAHLRETISLLFGGGKEEYEKIVRQYPVDEGWLRHLREYFIWVYLPGAVYDADPEGKLRMAAFFTAVMEEMLTAGQCGCDPGDPAALREGALIVSRAARELEHSDANLERMERY